MNAQIVQTSQLVVSVTINGCGSGRSNTWRALHRVAIAAVGAKPQVPQVSG